MVWLTSCILLVYHKAGDPAVKLKGHKGCPAFSEWAQRDGRGGKVLRLYYRDPRTRRWVPVGYLCVSCGLSEVTFSPRLPRQ